MNHATSSLPLHRLSDLARFAIIRLVQAGCLWTIAAARLVAAWRERTRQRRALATLDDRLLRDVGITRYEAEWECRKPFWR